MFSMKRVTSARPISPIGRLMRKIQCQEKYVVMNPPSGGAITGPTRARIVTHTMAPTSARRAMAPTRTRSARGGNSGRRVPGHAPDRAEHEHRDRRAEHRAGAEPVGGPAARRNEDGKRQ